MVEYANVREVIDDFTQELTVFTGNDQKFYAIDDCGLRMTQMN